jgi:hypothetical protein
MMTAFQEQNSAVTQEQPHRQKALKLRVSTKLNQYDEGKKDPLKIYKKHAIKTRTLENG